MSENKMTPAPWIFSNTGNYIIRANPEWDTPNICAKDMATSANWKGNAAAIVSAVNNTYGAGINPEAVPDMLEALKEAKRMYEAISPVGDGKEYMMKYSMLLKKLKHE